MVENKHDDKHRIESSGSDLQKTVVKKSQRMEAHRSQRDRNPWFGLGFMGLIGWSIAVPTLLGIWLGSILDDRFTGPPSWTLTCLLAGLLLGCVNAAYWINTENTKHTNHRKEKSDGS